MQSDGLLIPPLDRGTAFRVEMTCACHDCDEVPKHPDAGAIATIDGERVQTMHNGIRVVAGGYGGTWTEEIIARLRGHHEPQEEYVFHHLLQRLPAKATMVEIGGHWSYYSLWFLEGAPDQRRSIVVEPDPNNLEVGRRNAALNRRAVEFVWSSVGETSSRGKRFLTETAGTVEVPQVTVPELVARLKIDRLDVLHCDAQGAEFGVLRSSFGLMRERRIGFIVISTHAHPISGDALTHQRSLALVREAGGSVIAEHEVHESFSGDGLIVAHFGDDPRARERVAVSLNRYSEALFRNPLFDLDQAIAESHALRADIASLRSEIEKARKPAAAALKDAVASAQPNSLPTASTTPTSRAVLARLEEWRGRARAKVRRFVSRQRRSLEKRLRRFRAGSELPKVSGEMPKDNSGLSEPAETILRRLAEIRRGRASRPPQA